MERPLPRRFQWHITDETLDGTSPAFGPLSEATLTAERRYSDCDVLHSVLAISQPQAGMVVEDALPKGTPYLELISKIQTGCDALEAWGKSLVVDRIRLALLAGAQDTTQEVAANHYAEVASQLTRDIARITRQSTPPIVVLVQSAGSNVSGASEVILAEGTFDLNHPSLPAIVATPAYPWSLMPGTPMTHSADASLIMDELCAIAVQEKQNGRPWYCPSLQMAQVSGTTILAEFSSLTELVLEDGPHGFRIEGGENPPKITSVKVVSDRRLQIECDHEPTSDGSFLCYAWGHQDASNVTDRTANHGSLRDNWQKQSTVSDAQSLFRYALADRVSLVFGN